MQLIGKRLCVCQVSTEGTVSRSQTGHSDNGQKCADFTCTSASGISSIADLILNIRQRLHEHSKYTCKPCGSTFESMDQLLCHKRLMKVSDLFVRRWTVCVRTPLRAD